jgi:hypothetical protein
MDSLTFTAFGAFFQGALYLALVVSQGYGFALVVLLFAPGESQFDFRYSFFKVQL